LLNRAILNGFLISLLVLYLFSGVYNNLANVGFFYFLKRIGLDLKDSLIKRKKIKFCL